MNAPARSQDGADPDDKVLDLSAREELPYLWTEKPKWVRASAAVSGPECAAKMSSTPTRNLLAVLTVVNTGPPGWGGNGPPAAIAGLASCRSGGHAGNSKTNTLDHHSLREYRLKPPIAKFGVSQQPFSLAIARTDKKSIDIAQSKAMSHGAKLFRRWTNSGKSGSAPSQSFFAI